MVSLVEKITQLTTQPIVSLSILGTFHGESLQNSQLKENDYKFDKPSLSLFWSFKTDKFRGIVRLTVFEITLPCFALLQHVLLPLQSWITSLKINCLLYLNKRCQSLPL